jgi:toxin ParE1/3/4
MKPMVVRPAAEEDIEAAYLWYEGRQAHLGNEFLFAIRSALSQVSQYPEAHSIVDSDVRRVVVPRFPYGIFYRVYHGTVYVIACMHGRRDPERWRSRILG